MNKILRIITLLLLSNIAFAGGWVVGGGEIIEDATNPWFLNNTPMVRYCVLIDEANFGLTKAEAQQSIENGFKFWRRQYEKTKEYASEIPVLNGQIFLKEECNNTTDLKFQFGHLDLEQMEQLNSINRKVAVAVRTDYDRVNLRGKGFVYISPEKGPLRLTNPRVIKNPWSKSEGTLLNLVLIHELGHVFGQGHLNDNSIMDELFVERTLRSEPDGMTRLISEYVINDLRLYSLKNNKVEVSCSIATTSPIIVPIEPPNRPENKTQKLTERSSLAKKFLKTKPMNIETQMKTIKEFFGLNIEPGCVGASVGFKENKYFVSLSFTDNQDNTVRLKIHQEPDSYVRSDIESVLKIFLPKEQKVFKQYNDIEYHTFGVKEKLVVFKSHFVDESKGIRRPVVISISNSSSPRITAEFQGTAYLNILDGI